MEKSQPLRNAGKPIFDPFAERSAPDQEVSVGAPKFVQGERKTYTMHRPCGHCRGTGRRRDDNNSSPIKGDPTCSQCKLQRCVRGKMATDAGFVMAWGMAVDLFAFELTEAEVRHLEPNDQMGARFEIQQHLEAKQKARVLCDAEYAASRPEIILVVRHFA